jgi:hypothetical protein
MALEKSAEELKMNTDSLFREEMITDRKIGTIRILHPIKSDGTADDSRQRVYVGRSRKRSRNLPKAHKSPWNAR